MDPEEYSPIEVAVSVTEVESKANYLKEGPKLSEVLSRAEPRDNIISSTIQDESTDWEKVERVFTEKEGLEDLTGFLDKTIQVAGEVQDQQILNTANALKENLVYVGEIELKEAIAWLAARIKAQAQEGKNIFLYIGGNRSERYITMRILEEFDAITEESPSVRDRVRASDNPFRIAEAMSNSHDTIAMIADDFMLSGSRMQAFNGNMQAALIESGMKIEDIRERLHSLLVAAPTNMPEDRFPFGNVSAYYGLKTKPLEGILFTGVAITGSHCSTDYGFESPMRDFQKFLQENGYQVPKPLLTDIQRPYDNESTGASFTSYSNPEIQERWDRISRKYLLEERTSKV